MVPSILSINFGKYNISPQTWRSHVVCHGEILSMFQFLFCLWGRCRNIFFLYMDLNRMRYLHLHLHPRIPFSHGWTVSWNAPLKVGGVTLSGAFHRMFPCKWASTPKNMYEDYMPPMSRVTQYHFIKELNVYINNISSKRNILLHAKMMSVYVLNIKAFMGPKRRSTGLQWNLPWTTSVLDDQHCFLTP